MKILLSNAIGFVGKAFLLSAFLVFINPSNAIADFSFQNTPLKEVIQTIESETDYFFLYRESQIADVQITLSSTKEEILNDLRSLLAGYDINLKLDRERNQVLLVRRHTQSAPAATVQISGQVVDASTGERLPFATVSWNENNKRKGIATGSSGRFTIKTRTADPELEIRVSYIGFNTRDIRIDHSESNRIDDLTIRLEPEPFRSNEVIVSGFTGYNPSDTLLAGMIDAGRFSPLGESNSIRALQSHPSVSKGTALNNGLNVRGSTPDGFLVILDGMTIFNQSHLFGLLDSFNADAIQSSGYYFGITPANIDSPTGGTLNLITRTGSRNEFKNSIGLSNTTVNGTFEGPLGSRSSWLLSARTAYMDQISWFNNPKLIQWGLDIDRPKRIATNEPDFTSLVLQPGDATAQFVDLHGKIYHETSDGGRFILSSYLGGDRTSQLANRRTRSSDADGGFVFEEVETSNLWGNALTSVNYEKDFFNTLYSSTTVGFSSYETEFAKDDFVYSRISSDDGNESVTIFTYPFRNRSSMNELKINSDVDYSGRWVSAVLGGTWRYYRGSYSESSFDRPSFFSETTAHLADLYLHTEWTPLPFLELNTGVRGHYYSPGNHFLLAPRIQLRITPNELISLFGGYSGNHQFLHRVSLQNATTADVWILSSESQPPASSEQFTAGIEFTPFESFFLRAEAYHKTYDDLRLHELNTQTLENTFSGIPWFFRNSGDAKGVELLLRNRFRRFSITQSYTLSQMIFRNPELLNGEDFFADWDRTHSYNAVLESRIDSNLHLYLSWIMMSGAPNSLALTGTADRERLDAYYRLDSTLEYDIRFQNGSRLDLTFSVFNLLNRDNVWYRNYSFSFDETRSIPRLRPVPVDVLDLGIQPSFSITYKF
ncbi:MAG: TonB-dependent receptor [Balneolales bacterium]